MKRLMLYCQASLGIGHMIRSTELARGLAADFAVTLIHGGESIPGFRAPSAVDMVQLPAIKTDADHRELKAVDRGLSLQEAETLRRKQLMAAVAENPPDVLMIELFPFGRGRFAAELIPVIEAARDRGARIVCSLRDIVVTKRDRPRFEARVCRRLNRYFDLLLIHADPALHRLEESFFSMDELHCDVRYTGYVSQSCGIGPLPREDRIELQEERPLIVTSVGGGRFGHELLACVVETASLLEETLPHRISMFTGPFHPDGGFARLCRSARGRRNLCVRRHTPDLPSYLRRADLSIGMGGYNTTMSILASGTRAIMLPFTGNGEDEQALRVERLARLGRVRRLHREDLVPERLARAVRNELEREPAPLHVDFDGVRNTARHLRSLVQSRP